MRLFFLLSIFVFVMCQKSLAQDTDELTRSFHTQLKEGKYEEAKVTMLRLKRKLTYQLLNINNCFFSEYLHLCKKNGIKIVDVSEAALFVDMLRNNYGDKSSKIIKELSSSIKCFCEEADGTLSEWFYDRLKENSQLGLAERAAYQYQIAWAYDGSLNPYKSWQLFKASAEGYKSLDSTSVEYAQCLNGMAYVCRFLGKENIALPLYREIEHIYAYRYGNNSKQYAINCDNLGRTFLEYLNEPDSALQYMNMAYEILRKLNDTTQDMGIVLNNIACCYGKLDRRDEELEYLNQALRYYEEPSIVYRNIGYVHKINGNISEALKYFKKTDDNYQKTLCATEIAECYSALGDYDNFYNYEKRYFDYVKTVVRNNFREMIGRDRSAFCTRGRNCNLDSLFRISCRVNSSILARLCYDYLVFEKSQSLSCDQSIESIVLTASPNVREKYLALLNTKEVSKEYSPKYELLEAEFLRLLNKEVDYTNFLETTHKEIGAKLGSNDIAIEFYVADEHDENRIYALILNSLGEVTMINICASDNQAEIKDIWIKLQAYLIGVKRVFFSPDGILHTLPIESYNKNINADFYRLSSTRELVKSSKIIRKGTVIYGGLFYDTPIELLETDFQKYKEQKQEIDISYINYRGAILEETIPYLIGTKKEIEAISMICQSNKEDVRLFSENAGTEASFRNLSGMRKRLLHIATHGFYNKEERVKDEGQKEFLEVRIASHIVDEDNSLKRCGLLLSGAENGISQKVSLKENDGILTAHDISMLDLRGLEMVSLSACETGLGDITSDGVFGLQRGFKKAGIQSILMSLWKVDDEATCMLMTEFYKNWIGVGKTKHDALEVAKQTVRSHTEKGWDAPKYWAAFILLDALD